MHPEEGTYPQCLVEKLEGVSYEEWLRILGLSGLENKRLKSDFIAFYSFLRRGHGEGGAGLPGIQ